MTTLQTTQHGLSSYSSIPLIYSTSTQQPSQSINFSNFQNRFDNGPNNEQYGNKQISISSSSMQHSNFTFNNNIIGNRIAGSMKYESTSPGNVSPRLINSIQHQQQQPSTLGYHRYSEQKTFKSSYEPPLVQTTNYQPSHQILNSQHNYSFINNRSSLKNFQQKPWNQKESNYRNVSQINHTPISQYNYTPPPSYKYTSNTYEVKNQFKPTADMNQQYNTNYYRSQFTPVPLRDTFGGNDIRKTGNFGTATNFNGIVTPETLVTDINMPNILRPAYENNSYTYQASNLSYNKYPQSPADIPTLQQGVPSSLSNNPSLINPQNNSISYQTQQIQGNLQSKLLNRQLTQLKSDQSLKTTVVNIQNGVQQFPLKFDSHLKQQKDFTGFCGYKGKRIIFDAAQKTPFC